MFKVVLINENFNTNKRKQEVNLYLFFVKSIAFLVSFFGFLFIAEVSENKQKK